MSFQMNRRGFLGTTAFAAGFSIIGSGCCSCGFGQQKIRLAVCGVMGKGFSDWMPMVKSGPVSYTHLTLPTICSV